MKNTILKFVAVVLTMMLTLCVCAFADANDVMLISESDGSGSEATQAPIPREEVIKMVVEARRFAVKSDATLDFKDSDTVSDEAKGYVATAIERGIITGYADGTIRGKDIVTRAEIATIIVRSLNASVDNFDKSSFSDITENDWYIKYVECAKTLGIINGYEDGTFGGENEVTKEEATAMVERLIKLLEALEA
ncbi:MAG: S-layer homology domain-containing protein [Clostridia bacterium]|nr:S-layer homology domain-containing protein [Clostridia bacterium]